MTMMGFEFPFPTSCQEGFGSGYWIVIHWEQFTKESLLLERVCLTNTLNSSRYVSRDKLSRVLLQSPLPDTLLDPWKTEDLVLSL